MRKMFLTLGLCLTLALTAGAQTRKNWDFTKGWSQETISNIEQAVANGDGWICPDEEFKGRYVTDTRTANTEMTVNINGEPWVVPEAAGLVFGAKASQHIGMAFNYEVAGFFWKSYLWINGGKAEDTFIVPAVKPGEKVFVVYEPARLNEKRGLKASTDGVIADGTDQVTNQVTAEGLDTAVFVVPDTVFSEITDVKLQTVDGGLFIYRICVGDELYEGEPEPELTDIAYVFNSSYAGYSPDMDVIRSMFLGTDEFVKNKTVTEIDLAGDVSAVDRDSLLGFDLVIVSSAVNGDEPLVPVLKSAIAYVPMLNLSARLYPAWGYGEPVATGDWAVMVGEAARSWSLFEQHTSAVPIVGEDGMATLFQDAGTVSGYTAPDGTYFASDSVIAVTATDSIGAIHIHNMTRNAYMLLPYSYENVPYGAESMGSIIPNAISLLKDTKLAIPQTQIPEISLTYKKLRTEVTLTCATDGARLYYTLDGSDPVTGGTLYTGPFVISEENVKVRAAALGDGFSYSEVAESEPVAIKDQVATPVITVEKADGKSTFSVTCETPGVDIFFNFGGSNNPLGSELYLEPVELTSRRTVTAFAVSYDDNLVQSEPAKMFVPVHGIVERIDTLAHMTSAESVYGSGDIVKAYSFWTNTQATDDDGNPAYDEDGNIIYLPRDSMTYKDFGSGWAVGSYGQRINNQKNVPSDEIGNSTYGPMTIYDFGASAGAMSFLKTKTEKDPVSAWLQTTVRHKAPFDIVVYMTGQLAVGERNAMEISVSSDSVNWTAVDTVETFECKNIERKTASYEGTDEVYVRLNCLCDTSMTVSTNVRTMLFDVILLNYGEKSREYQDFLTGIETLRPEGGVVRTEVYGISGARRSTMGRGINIVKETYANGTVRTRKVVVR